MSRDPSHGDAVVDPGLQAERTRLAWGRTAMSLAIVGALMVHPFGRHLTVSETIPGLVMLAVAFGTWWYGGHRYRSVVARLRADRSIVATRPVAAFAWLCLLPAAIGLWAVLT